MDTFFWYGKFAALYNLDGHIWSVSAILGHSLNLLHDLVSLQDFAEDNVLAVKMAIQVSGCCSRPGFGYLRWGRGSDEELGTIRIFSSVCHGHKTLLGVLQLEVLVGELVTVDCQCQ